MTAPRATAPPDFASFFLTEFRSTVRSVQRVAGESAEDVVQEAFVVAFGQWERVAILDAPDAWVRLVARRIAWRRQGRDLERRRRESEAALEGGIPAGATSFEDPVRTDLERAMAGLSLRERAAVRLHYLVDLPISRVAEVLGCSESAAKVCLLRARDRLAEALIGHRGRWTAEARWDADDIVRQLKETGDERHADVVIEEVPLEGARWALVLERGAYSLDTEDNVNLDRGRYQARSGVVRLVPWTGRGHIVIRPVIDGARARFQLVADTTPPTRGVPDEVYLRLLLESASFSRTTQVAVDWPQM